MSDTSPLLVPTAAAPAPGVAEASQVAVVVGVVAVVYAALAWLVLRERTGHRTLLGALAARVAGLDGTPRWAAISPFVQTAAILAAGFGVWWDISFHIDHGRDQGPFGTPAHYPIFFGLLGVMASGVITCALAAKPVPAGSLRLRPGWRLPLSGVFVVVCGTFSLIGFPLDDTWHRIFGEDVTLWGPTHILMIGGAVIALFALFLLRAEAVQVSGPRRRYVFLDVVTGGALLIAFELFATEFDYGVPQFPLLNQPLLLVLGTVLPLVLTRARRGSGSALGSLLVYLVVRGSITALVAGPLDRVMPHFPPYVVEALLVEGVALVVGTSRRFRFGSVTGVVVGVLGVLAEYGWSHVWMPIPWPGTLLPPALGLGVVMGVGAGLVAAWVATRLDDVAGTGTEGAPPVRRGHLLAAVGLAAVFVPLAVAVPRSATPDVRAQVDLAPQAGSSRSAVATVHLHPADAADHATWFIATSFQGGHTHIAPMVRVSEGVWRTPFPIRLDGRYKSTLRLHRGLHDMLSLPVHMPADPQIGKPEIRVSSGSQAAFVDDEQVLRREERTDLPGWYWTAGYGALGLVSALELGILAWLLTRAGAAARALRRPAGIPSGRVPSLTR
ncbi:hypothetical protein [Oryzihumus sp.]